MPCAGCVPIHTNTSNCCPERYECYGTGSTSFAPHDVVTHGVTKIIYGTTTPTTTLSISETTTESDPEFSNRTKPPKELPTTSK